MILNPLLAVLRHPSGSSPVMDVVGQGEETWIGGNLVRVAPAPDARFNLITNTFESADKGTADWTAIATTKTRMTSGAAYVAFGNFPCMKCDPDVNDVQVNFSVTNAMFRRTTAGANQSHVASFYAYHEAGANKDVTLSFQHKHPNGANAVVATTTVSVPTATVTRISVTGTPTRPFVYLEITSTTGGADLYIAKPMIEVGSSVGDFFSGETAASETYPAPTWIYAGGSYEAPACYGYSVSDCGYLVEDERKQWVTNPWFAVDTAGHTAVNCALARITNTALQGPGNLQLTASAANAAHTVSIAPGNGVEVQCHAIVVNRAAVSRTVHLEVDGVEISGTSTVVAAGDMAELRGVFTGSGGAKVLGVEWTDSANTEVFHTLYLGAIGPLLDTSASDKSKWGSTPMPEIDSSGTIRGGFLWSGTAHASTSTFWIANLRAYNGSFFSTNMLGTTGAYAVQFSVPAHAMDDASYLAQFGYLRTTTGASFAVTVTDTFVYGLRYDVGDILINDSVVVANTLDASTRQTIVFEWNREKASIYLLEKATSGTDSAFTIYEGAGHTDAWITAANRAVSSLYGNMTGCLLNAAWFSAPLDTATRNKLRDTKLWTTAVFDTVAANYTELHCTEVVDNIPGVSV